MDNLTHALTGLMISRAGCNRLSPHASAILMLAANISDADGIVRIFGTSLDYLDDHRGWTHTFAGSPLVAAASVLLVAAVARKRLPWIKAWFIAWLGVLSHIVLDWTNTYGLRMLLPFRGDWLHLDITNVVDIWIWAVLLLAVAGPLLSKLVSSEIGAKPGTGRGAAIFALSTLVLYEGARFVLHERAVQTLNSHSYAGAPAKRVAAFPHFGNPFEWISYVEFNGGVALQRINLLFPYDPTAGTLHYPPQPSQALEAARRTSTVQRFLSFAQYPFWVATPLDRPEGSTRIEVIDLRFGDPSSPRFVASVVVDASGRVLEEDYGFGPLKPR
ncbi:MAG: metal-dependent hydrolase [Bryobacterales bacterium]|nr:metal-dependent hydrolase [Bryobacterales bacterium]